jgi:hypothetical protein
MAHKEARMVSQALWLNNHTTYILMACKEARMVNQAVWLK